MKKSKKNLLSLGIGLGVASIAASLATSLTLGIKSNYLKIDSIDKNKKVLFNNLEFKNYDEAYSYAKSMIKKQNFDSLNKELWTIDYEDTSYIFDSPLELNNFINNQIKVINTETDITNHKLNPSDNSIINSEMHKYNIDTEKSWGIQPC